ncbi:GMC oxidoreductase [Chitinophaga sp. HK235]|uniref:GMC oxidoreductase n=1 Tax=Chitinophaga sp. HK235 TaxID=2952571 RepID=UPI001BA92D42|nr:GMC family oxidoreductase [Chitinophaga sp. HK235]
MKKIYSRLLKKSEQLFLSWLLPSSEKIEALHYALFDFFLPYKDDNEEVRAAIAEARIRQYAMARKNQQLMWILLFISRPALLLKSGWIRFYFRNMEKTKVDDAVITAAVAECRQFLSGLSTTSFVKMTDLQRNQFLQLLTNSRINFYRRIGAGIRAYYIVNVYKGRIGRLLSGIGDFKQDAFIPDLDIPVPAFKTPLQYDSRQRCISGEIDCVVIGSGPSGCLVAAEMHKAGKRVLILESGSFFIPGTFDGRAGLQFYEDKGFRTTSDGGVFVLNGSVVGGGATVNVDMAFEPMIPSVSGRFERWHAEGIIDDSIWTSPQLKAAHDSIAHLLNTRAVEHSEMNAHNKILYDGGLQHGLRPHFYKLNTYKPGESPYKRTDKRGPVEHYILDAMQDKHNPITLIPDAQVEKLVIKNGKVTGIEFEVRAADTLQGIIADPFRLGLPLNKRITVSPHEVVVAGGNLGSSVLLKKSGLSDPMIGRGFIMHPFMLVLGLFDHIVDNHIGTQSSVYISDYLTTDYRRPAADFMIESASARPEIAAMLLPGNPVQVLDCVKQYRYLGGIGVLLIDEVNPENRVEVNVKGEPEIYYRLSDKDIERFRYGVKEAIEIMFKGGARKVILPSFERLSGSALEPTGCNMLDSMDQAADVVARLNFNANETLLFAAHMMGGVKMSSDPSKGCIDKHYRVNGVDNLYVADASVYPSSVGANPMQTIYSTAKIFVDNHLHKRNHIDHVNTTMSYE